MQDLPKPEQLLAEVARFLRDEAGPALAGAGHAALAYQARVAANMAEIAARQAQLAAPAEAAEHQRLLALLGGLGGLAPSAAVAAAAADASTDQLSDLNRRLAEAIADGSLSAQAPGLVEHLWQSTLDKLAVDQPGYDGLRSHGAMAPGEDG